MGLSGRKFKQRIGKDPRNLSWADDAARFGKHYLAKFGWDSSKGLGASGDGRQSHLKVSQKLDMLGIGAAHQSDPNGIAWKQNKDFENLLKRLNGDTVVEDAVIGGFKTACEDVAEGNTSDRKGKRKQRDDTADSLKKRKKIKSAEINIGDNEVLGERKTVSTVPRHRSHRARAIAAKNISSKSAAHISEILGIAPTPSLSFPSVLALDQDTPQVVEPIATLEIEKITTSKKSVHDYFNEKLKSKTSKYINHSTGTLDYREQDSSYYAPRCGLGSSLSHESSFSSLDMTRTTKVKGKDKRSKVVAAFEDIESKKVGALTEDVPRLDEMIVGDTAKEGHHESKRNGITAANHKKKRKPKVKDAD